jgi:hypothetical protein
MYYTNCIIQNVLYKMFNILRLFYRKNMINTIYSAIIDIKYFNKT